MHLADIGDGMKEFWLQLFKIQQASFLQTK